METQRLNKTLNTTSVPFSMDCVKKGIGSVYRRLFETCPISTRDDRSFAPPLFIVGSGRSGTTLLRSILAAGGEVAIPVETHILHSLPVKFVMFNGLGWEDLCRLVIATFESHPDFYKWEINLAPVYQKVIPLEKKNRSLARIIDEIFWEYASQKFPEALFWGDQSPINTFYWKNIARVFPHARYIHMLRDGRDVCASLVDRYGEDYLPGAVQRWKNSIKHTTDIRKSTGSRYLEIKYEHLVTDPDTALDEICKFLGIQFQPQMLDFYKKSSTIENRYDSFHQNIGRPLFTTSIGSWSDRLSLAQAEYVIKELASELRKNGYME